jgi:hypothetical protein
MAGFFILYHFHIDFNPCEFIERKFLNGVAKNVILKKCYSFCCKKNKIKKFATTYFVLLCVGSQINVDLKKKAPFQTNEMGPF